MQLRDDVFAQLKSHARQREVWLAYSGGIDSHVLLHLLIEARKHGLIECLSAIHIDHGLNEDSAKWAGACQQHCDTWHVPMILCTIQKLESKGSGLEAAARQARYDCFIKHLPEDAILCLAHHQKDQAETVIMNLMRGSGVYGLSGMPTLREYARQIQLLRPMLDCSKEQVEDYAALYDLNWIDDPSNDNTNFSRNFVRHKVLPVLDDLWPKSVQAIAATAQQMGKAVDLMDDLARQDQLLCQPQPDRVSLTALAGLTPARQENLLRYALKSQDILPPPANQLSELLRQSHTAHAQANPSLTWSRGCIRRYRDQLYLMKGWSDLPEDWSAKWDGRKPLDLPANLGTLSLKDPKKLGLTVRFRQGGETIEIDDYHRMLKTLFQEWGIPAWERARVPLIYQGEILVEVVGYYPFSSARRLIMLTKG